MAEIQINQLRKSFSDFVAVKNSNLVLEDGRFVVLLGPSGCGKTTTLRMIAGLEYPSSGQILLDGEDVTWRRPRERDIAMVFQLFALYPHMGVRENLEFPLRNEGLARGEIDRRIAEVAAILRIEHLLDARIGGLSGGDRQRVALGRAIVRQPKAFLMDEPLGTLDAEFRELMCVELRRLHDRLKTTTVFVTHDQNEAMALADHIVVMNQGEILQSDTPEGVYNFPSCLFVARFIGRPAMNLLPLDEPVTADRDTVRVAGTAVTVPRPRASVQRALLGVHPEHVSLRPAGEGIPARVAQVEYFGSHWVASLATAAGNVCALVGKEDAPTVGDAVGITFDAWRAVLFDASSEQLIPSAATLARHAEKHHV